MPVSANAGPTARSTAGRAISPPGCSRKGLTKGDRVAIMMPNVPAVSGRCRGVLRAGCIVVNVNPLYTPRELEHQLKDSGAKAIVILENFANTLQQVIGETPIKHVVVASIGDLLGFPKGMLVNFVVRTSRRWCRPIRCPARSGSRRRWRRAPPAAQAVKRRP